MFWIVIPFAIWRRSDPVFVLRALRHGRALRENLRCAIEKLREKKGVRELDV
jgi:hypothetical protein